MKASELRPGQFFEFVGDHMHTRWRSLASRIEGRAWYINSHFVMYWCGLDCDVTPLAVAGWDDEASESEAKQLNIDSGDEKFELARALHRVVRAMHDGHCPRCGHLASSMEFEPSEGYHCCPECLFAITKEEADEALAMFLPYMQKNYDKFAAWQLHGRFVKPVEPAPSTPDPQPFRAGDLVVGDFYYDNFRWEHIGMGGDITHYRVVEQPPAKYRPFASAEEFRPHRDRWLRCKEGHTYRVILVSELGVRIAWMTSLIQFDEMFNTFVFDDNSEPCGVRE